MRLGRLAAEALASLLSVVPPALADDWPTYRHDNGRSGVTAERLEPPLVEHWIFRPRHAPDPACDDPSPKPVGGWWSLVEQPRVRFDDAFHVTAAGGSVYFGSSADGTVTALEAATGRVRWSFPAGGPVRLAPAVWNGRVLFGSDDGQVYGLDAERGSVLWKVRAAPGDRRVLGHGRMISLWPVRTGVLVDGGTAYFGAGIFPSEGLRLGAVRAEDGKEVWRSEPDTGDLKCALSPQGYLLASAERLFVPMGRVPPAAFDRKDGRLLYTTYFDHMVGGTQALLVDGELYTGTEEILGFKETSKASRVAWFPGRRLVVSKDTAYYAADREVVAVDRAAYGPPSLRHRTLAIRKLGLNQRITEARPILSRLESSVKDAQVRLEALERQLEGPPAPEKAKAALLEAERDALKKKQESEAKELQSTRLSLKRQEADLEKLNPMIAEAEAEARKAVRWRTPCDGRESIILAGDTVFAGGEGKVTALRAATGETVWSGQVEGKARGLAVAEGRLYVSTDGGLICCFGRPGVPLLRPAAVAAAPPPYPPDELTLLYEAAAEAILREAAVTRGYCLVYGAEKGRLAYELARRTDLAVYGIEPDAAKVEAARMALLAAGLWGKRVVIEQGPLSRVPYADYFANLAVSDRTFVTGELPGEAAELVRLLKPLGGVALLGRPSRPVAAEEGRRWLRGSGAPEGRVTASGWLRVERGALEGAGSWTHQYAEPGNTACGDDRIVKGPLEVLWYGSPGPDRMVERHSGAAAPLSFGGRFFVQGEDVVMAFDAYNGIELWTREIPGALRKGLSSECSNFASDGESLFVAAGNKCLRLEAATGRTAAVYELPPAADGAPRRWGYVAAAGGFLFGSRSKAGRDADAVFAVDLRTGSRAWLHEGKKISQVTIAVAEGRVLFADPEVTSAERQEALRERAREIADLRGEELARAQEALRAAEIWRVTALDAATGARRWERCVDLGGCRRLGKGGGNLFAMARGGVLVLCAACTDGHYWEQFFHGDFAKRRVVVLSAGDGGPLWSRALGYRIRPLIVGDTLVAEPWAFDLRTGEQKTRVHPVTGGKAAWQFARPGHHCGPVNACPQALFFRSYSIGYYDLAGDSGTMHFTGQRPGCWMNIIPANGVVVVPESSSGCMCAFPNMCTVALQPRKEGAGWALYSVPGPSTPVKDLAINLGAPGDRKAADGALWLGYPRPSGSLVFPLKLETRILPRGGYYRDGAAAGGTDKPWVFASGCRGLARCVVPLAGEGEPPGVYAVRLGFVEPDNDVAGKRIFDVRLQGKTVLEGFDVFRAAGGRNVAVVKEFAGVQAQGSLTIELVPKGPSAAPEGLPVLNSIEVARTRELALGILAPSFLTGDLRPGQSRAVAVVNHSDREWTGRIEARGGGGIAVEPASRDLRLGPGERAEVALKVSVAAGTPAGEYAVALRGVGAGGAVEAVSQALVTHLGGEREVALAASADAVVKRQSPQRNFGAEPQLWVDGGEREMGDAAESLVYFRFRLEVPGRPVSATLRLRVGTWADSDSGDAGTVRLVRGRWEEDKVTWENRPALGEEVGKVGRVKVGEVVERRLDLRIEGLDEVSVAVVPAGLDGCAFASRETGETAELVVRFGP